MNRQHTTFDELFDVARAKGLTVGLAVPLDKTNPFRREVTAIRITRRDTPKGAAYATAPTTLDTLDETARQMLKALR